MILPAAVTRIDLPGIPRVRSGKVRELFDVGDYYLIVATDRISAFDCILPTGIPGKGFVLNQLSAWWFRRLRDVVPNHFITDDVRDYPAMLQPYADRLKGRSMLVRKAEVLPIECVARGYLIGSGWVEYQRTGSICGIPLRPGYRMADRLDEPIFTPATKAESGHDQNITFEEAAARVGWERAEELRAVSLALYQRASEHAERCGLILADTKFEFGLAEGSLLLIDEVLTPDSSRYWPADSYAPGKSPPSFDKQYVRDYLESLGWNKQPPAPPLPDDVAKRTAAKYVDAFVQLTGSLPNL
ncbi:MAG: phosphoribosylaminoimidazolesuccinocarboxamide synthase [Kiritimatiellae bacterium]|nr:phosphoribosylaminoimidazolesuccinocarboxamide synthase [Kiritimatiellia bacterium]MDW8458228.1 phosphoribosylaminoimidazolesuccinocarboxamide synthase [Verrucomicrobiota bacterium]